MKTKYTIGLLCAALLTSVIANVVLAKANFSYFDMIYGTLAQQHLLNSRVKASLESSDVETAKAILNQEIESKGAILAICLTEDCSSSAKEIMHAK